MCKRCDKQVKDMDIRDTDLPNLPYKIVKLQCVVPGCNNGIRLRDYGITPLYYWPVKVRRFADGKWRGGWVDASIHYKPCSRHWKQWEEDENNGVDPFSRYLQILPKEYFTGMDGWKRYLLSRIV